MNMMNLHVNDYANPLLSCLSFYILLVLVEYLFQFVLLMLFVDHLGPSLLR